MGGNCDIEVFHLSPAGFKLCLHAAKVVGNFRRPHCNLKFLAHVVNERLNCFCSLGFAEPFDPERATLTPSGLAPAPESGTDPIVTRMVDALVALDRAGVA